MSSSALRTWREEGLARLTELETVHATVVEQQRGRRPGTRQLNRSLFVALSAQFQRYCRTLHDEAVEIHVAAATAAQRPMLEALLTRGRRLESGNARRASLGSDFERLGISIVADLQQKGVRTSHRFELLDAIVDFRNAISHGDEAHIATIERAGQIAATKASYRKCRRALEALAATLDHAVAAGIGRSLGTGPPW